MDHRKIMKALVAIVMAAVLVVLVMLTVNHVKAGLMTTNSKLMLTGYAAMMLYAAYRMFANIRDIFTY
jgi:hypothetical protein